ncbi:fibronectin type III domain-containing protein [Bacillus tropicus]|uniref:fibronectin type III domain-containing protein n=1 Tax=Bacillus tropicus TaxID=2026188 RepID=UPI0021D22D27|nr:fibronectin type III domain-containing protein [Bacillus tropicus]MCU5227004.1 fibronectin type III domain-containing protein [Bacillus tropicus]
MKFKKCGFLLSLAMVFCFALPNFASAEVIDVLRGKTGTSGYGGEMTDGNSSTCTRIFDDTKISQVTFDLGLSYKTESFYALTNSNNGANLKVTFQNSSRQTITQFRGANGSVNASYSDVRYIILEPQTTSFAVNVCTFSLYANDGKVSDIKNLQDKPSSNEISFNWTNPTEESFVGVKVYMNGKLLDTLDKKATSYVAKGLEVNKTYEFKFAALDLKGRETKGVIRKPTTTMPVIKPPENVFLTPQDKKIVIAWDDVKSPYLQGYNVYVDGKKINDKPLTSNKLIVKNLENDKSYKVQVSAVNKNNVEGEKSKEKTDKPSSDALEVEYDVQMPFNVKEVLDVAMMLLLIVAPLTLLGLAFIYYKPIVTFLYNSIQKKK